MVERNEVDQMAKFLLASRNLGENFDDGPGVPMVTTETGRIPDLADLNPDHGKIHSRGGIAPAMALSTNDVSEMKTILERFNAATGNIVAEASYDRPLREAFQTQATPQGARIGGWDIVVNQVGKRKLYDVIQTATGQKIASELLIYEAARSLVRHLNDGGMINSPQVLELLRSEQDYAGAIHDMRLYNHHLKKAPDSPRAPIYEDRYGAAKRKAITARDRVEKLSESM